MQWLGIASLLMPKALLASFALMVVPYVYVPICLVAEVCIVVLLNLPLYGFKIRDYDYKQILP